VEQLHVGRFADTDPDFNLYIRISSIDGLQEFKVVSGIYPAEFGSEAAHINVSAKSGTNDFRAPSQQRSRREAFDFLATSPAEAPLQPDSPAFYADDTHKMAHRRLAVGNDPARAGYDAEHDQIQGASGHDAQAGPSRYPVFVRAGTNGWRA
jgi:hypothetical protein